MDRVGVGFYLIQIESFQGSGVKEKIINKKTDCLPSSFKLLNPDFWRPEVTVLVLLFTDWPGVFLGSVQYLPYLVQ